MFAKVQNPMLSISLFLTHAQSTKETIQGYEDKHLVPFLCHSLSATQAKNCWMSVFKHQPPKQASGLNLIIQLNMSLFSFYAIMFKGLALFQTCVWT